MFLLLLILTSQIVWIRKYLHSSVLVSYRSQIHQEAVEMCSCRVTVSRSGCTRSGMQGRTGNASRRLQEGKGRAVSGSPFGPTVHVIVGCDVAYRSPIFNHRSMSQIFVNHLFKCRTSRLWGFGWGGGEKGRRKIPSRSWKSCVSWGLVGVFLKLGWKIRSDGFSLTHRW